MNTKLFPLLAAVLALCSAGPAAQAQIEWRISVKFILDANGRRPPGGPMNSNAEVTNRINYANDIYRASGRGYQFRLTEIVDLAGVSQWFNADSTSGSVRNGLSSAARNNTSTYAFRNNVINVYVNNSTNGGICSFPADGTDIIIVGQGTSIGVLPHEVGHFFDLCHTQGCACGGCDTCGDPESDGLLDTLADRACWTQNDIAQRAYGTTYNDLTAAQSEAVDNTFFNIMSYHPTLNRVTSDQLDRQTDTSNGARLNVASGRTRFVDYRNNAQSPTGSSARLSPLPFPNGTGGPFPTVAQGVFFGNANDIVLIRVGTYEEGLMLDRPLTLRATRGDAILR